MDSALAPNNIDLTTIPARILNVSSRMCLSRLLNPEQPLWSSNGCARDYRGLAELMDFEYMDIRNFQRHEDPTFKILDAWQEKPTATLGNLLNILQKMERQDVVVDALPLFRKDAMAYVRRKMVAYESPVQVPEVSSCRALEQRMDSADILTIHDLQCETGYAVYDAYVCYAKEDIFFIRRFVEYLESPNIGLKLFIKGRDLLPGVQEFDAYVKLIEERCRRMIIVLSPDFLKSPECEFQTNFATGLSIEERNRKLIPIVYKECECPSILRFVTKIKFSKREIGDWLWEKLVTTLRGKSSSSHLPSLLPQRGSMASNDNITDNHNRSQYPELSFSSSSQYPSIIFPDASQNPRKPCEYRSQNAESIASTFCNSPSMSDWVVISNEIQVQGTVTEPVITFPPTSEHPFDTTETPSAPSDAALPSLNGEITPINSPAELQPGYPPCTKKKGFKNFFKLKLGSSKSSTSSSATSGFFSGSDKMNDVIELACEVKTNP